MLTVHSLFYLNKRSLATVFKIEENMKSCQIRWYVLIRKEVMKQYSNIILWLFAQNKHMTFYSQFSKGFSSVRNYYYSLILPIAYLPCHSPTITLQPTLPPGCCPSTPLTHQGHWTLAEDEGPVHLTLTSQAVPTAHSLSSTGSSFSSVHTAQDFCWRRFHSIQVPRDFKFTFMTLSTSQIIVLKSPFKKLLPHRIVHLKPM